MDWKSKKGVLVEVGEGEAIRLTVTPVNGPDGGREGVLVYVEKNGGESLICYLLYFSPFLSHATLTRIVFFFFQFTVHNDSTSTPSSCLASLFLYLQLR